MSTLAKSVKSSGFKVFCSKGYGDVLRPQGLVPLSKDPLTVLVSAAGHEKHEWRYCYSVAVEGDQCVVLRSEPRLRMEWVSEQAAIKWQKVGWYGDDGPTEEILTLITKDAEVGLGVAIERVTQEIQRYKNGG